VIRFTTPIGLAALLSLAGCGEAVDQKALDARPAETPPPAAAPTAAAEPVTAQSPLDICLRAATNTPASDACFSEEDKQRTQALNQYTEAAVKQLADDKEALDAFQKTQSTWQGYRDAYCNAVYTYWRDGTIRSAKAMECRIDLTATRTHQIWKDYLTHPDGTPPVLPEPLGVD